LDSVDHRIDDLAEIHITVAFVVDQPGFGDVLKWFCHGRDAPFVAPMVLG
jgi:hypothetical protein